MKKILILFLSLIPFLGISQPDIIVYDWLRTTQTTRFGYDTDYQKILNRATALGYTLPSDAQKALQNDFLVGLKSAGIWSGLDVLYVYATDGSSDFATLNWKNPSLYQCTKVNSPTFTTNQGFAGNGTTSYLDTNWNPSINAVNFTQDLCSIGEYVNSNIHGTLRLDVGAISGSSGISLNPRSGSNQYLARINSSVATTGSGLNLNSQGFYQFKRLNSTDIEIYNGGVLVHSQILASTPLVNLTLYVGGINPTGFSPRQISMMFVGNSLSGLELSFYNLWNAYFTSL